MNKSNVFIFPFFLNDKILLYFEVSFVCFEIDSTFGKNVIFSSRPFFADGTLKIDIHAHSGKVGMMQTWPLIVLIFLLAACGRPPPEPGGVRRQIPLSCLAAYADRPAELLTATRAASIAGRDDAGLVKTSDGRSVIWSWPSERVRRIEIGETGMEMLLDNQIGLMTLRVFTEETAAEYAERTFRHLSDEEVAQRTAEIQRRVQDRVDRRVLSEDLAPIALQADLAALERIREVEAVHGLGDLARWVVHEQRLAVAHRNTLLLLFVDIADEPQLNRDGAVTLAEQLLALCDEDG